MSQTLKLVPGASQSTSVIAPGSSSTSTSHSQHTGSHDAMRYGPSVPLSAQHAADAKHPAQDRLERWDQTRDELKLNMSRNVYGVGAPVRTLMERKIVGQVSARTPIEENTVSGLKELDREGESRKPLRKLKVRSKVEPEEVNTWRSRDVFDRSSLMPT